MHIITTEIDAKIAVLEDLLNRLTDNIYSMRESRQGCLESVYERKRKIEEDLQILYAEKKTAST